MVVENELASVAPDDAVASDLSLIGSITEESSWRWRWRGRWLRGLTARGPRAWRDTAVPTAAHLAAATGGATT